MSLPISVYIITKNEAERIGRVIASVVDWVDEVVVVDSGSEDETVQMAERAGARVLFNAWPGYGPQKRFAEEQCRNDWLFNLDADEEVSLALAAEIQRLFAAGGPTDQALRMRVTDVLPGELEPKWFAYSYRIVRLYDRRHGRCSDHPYKDRVQMESGSVGRLAGRIYHHSFRSWETTVDKLNFYTSQLARDRCRRPLPLLRLRLFTEFPLQFLKCYLCRRFIFRGSTGLAMSLTIAYLNLLRLLKTDERLRCGADASDQGEAEAGREAADKRAA